MAVEIHTLDEQVRAKALSAFETQVQQDIKGLYEKYMRTEGFFTRLCDSKGRNLSLTEATSTLAGDIINAHKGDIGNDAVAEFMEQVAKKGLKP